ncbi:amidase [Rhodoligotrophos defluvii]|uniref:amidase n=1 Tax=Rhodoligotrophos defluvii TaxID=2561934 RepID=UPI00148564C8|nr:amidase family protein [Rhodoligotrophos defluvii]
MGSAAAIVEDRLARRDRQVAALANAVLDWWDDGARRQADLIDRAASPDHVLRGLTLSVKANVDVEGARTTAASKALDNVAPAAADAPVVAKLRAAGAIFLAQTNMVEFAYGALGPNPHHGAPLSPLFPGERRVTGGSSSGAAVTVALGVVDAALGTDTSGSVRIPAACCGVASFKPTQGRYSAEGIIPLTPTFDTAGFLAPDITTCDRLDAAVTGRTVTADVPPLAGTRFLVPRGFLTAVACDNTMLSRFERALDELRRAGAAIADADMSYLVDVGDAARAGSMVAVEALSWHEALLAERAERYDPRVAPRIAAGASVPALTYFRARRQLEALADRYAADIGEAVAILTPTVPGVPPKLSELAEDARYLALNLRIMRLTEIANRINVPSLTVPIGDGAGAASILLTGQRGDDIRLLETGRAIEAVVREIK